MSIIEGMTNIDRTNRKMNVLHSLWVVAAATVIAYSGISFVLLRFPNLLHKKKKVAFRCAHISHRGGAGENLENTMAAFHHALRCGTHMLEIDCQLTRDGQVVVAHDNCLRRLAGINGHISDLDYKDLPPLRKELPLDFNRDYICRLNGTDRRIPLLRELFMEFPDTPVNIDIKRDDDRLIEEVSRLVKEYKREHLTVWGNFANPVCLKCYQHNPQIHLLFSMRRVLILIAFYYVGLLPFIPLKEDFLEILMPSVFLNNPHILYQPTARQTFLLRIIDWLIMNKKLFTHLRQRGIHVYLWVLNNEEEYKRAFELGADGVMTDFPSKLKDFLARHPEFDREDDPQ